MQKKKYQCIEVTPSPNNKEMEGCSSGKKTEIILKEGMRKT